MNPTDRVVFTWWSYQKTKCELRTTGEYFKNYAIELMEDEKVDKVFNAHYSINEGKLVRLDYYNTLGDTHE